MTCTLARGLTACALRRDRSPWTGRRRYRAASELQPPPVPVVPELQHQAQTPVMTGAQPRIPLHLQPGFQVQSGATWELQSCLGAPAPAPDSSSSWLELRFRSTGNPTWSLNFPIPRITKPGSARFLPSPSTKFVECNFF